MRLLPYAIIKRRHLHGADLVLVETFARVGGGLGPSGRHNRETRVQAERGGKARGDDITTRHVQHGVLPLSCGWTPAGCDTALIGWERRLFPRSFD
jgi:hypothetical protein